MEEDRAVQAIEELMDERCSVRDEQIPPVPVFRERQGVSYSAVSGRVIQHELHVACSIQAFIEI
jgi:hypothetical protein